MSYHDDEVHEDYVHEDVHGDIVGDDIIGAYLHRHAQRGGYPLARPGSHHAPARRTPQGHAPARRAAPSHPAHPDERHLGGPAPATVVDRGPTRAMDLYTPFTGPASLAAGISGVYTAQVQRKGRFERLCLPFGSPGVAVLTSLLVGVDNMLNNVGEIDAAFFAFNAIASSAMAFTAPVGMVLSLSLTNISLTPIVPRGIVMVGKSVF